MMMIPSAIVRASGALALVRTLQDSFRRKTRREAEMRQITRLLELDDHLFRDIGITRDHARQELHRLRRER